ncbi:MAG TPA: acyl-CoA desaturase [Chitinophagaceae bacterium]|nr:acyl-CoA desaturase [Chitinophagaceae bacterium]
MEKIRFQPEPINGFYNTLKQRVLSYFRDNKIRRYANAKAIIKAVIFFGLYVSAYVIILRGQLPLWALLLTWFFMGVSIIFTAMSIVHDAAHAAFSSRRWVNRLLLQFANLVGGDGYMYKYKHTVSHHPYTNIHGIDIDLEQSSLVRVTPFTKSKGKHRHQYWYMKILYPFYILFWVLFRDFKYYRMEKIGPVKAHHAIIHWVFLFVSKAFYFFYMLILPSLILPNPFWQIFLGFVLMHVGSGVVAMFALLSNHVVEDSLFVVPDENGLIKCSWGEHQLRTTDDYSPDSPIVSFFFSGLNHHVAHHLFPNYCHVHYPAITKIVRATASEFGLRYRYNSITGGLHSHFRLLKKLSSINKKKIKEHESICAS